MAHDKNVSPTGWYIASYLLRFTEIDASGNDDPEARFLSWENTVIVQAPSLEEAYDKVVEIATESTEPYLGGPDAVPVQWLFEGVTELLPIYEPLEDGAAVMWGEHHPRKLKNLRKLVRQRHQFRQ
ncbi:DUF4288 domain-containing protein [Pseudomonas sp. zjy_8]